MEHTRSSKKPYRKRLNMAVSSVRRCRTAGVLFEPFEPSLLAKHRTIGQRGPVFFDYEKSVDIHVRFWVSISFIPEEKRFSSWSWDSKQHDSMWQQQQTILEYREKVWNWGKLRIVNLLPWASWSLDLVAHHVMSTRSVIHRNSGYTTIAGTKHPFAGYFYVHQGYRVLTRPCNPSNKKLMLPYSPTRYARWRHIFLRSGPLRSKALKRLHR